MNNWIKTIWGKIIEIDFKLVGLFILGFLIGILFKSQAGLTIVKGYDDHLIIKNNGNIFNQDF